MVMTRLLACLALLMAVLSACTTASDPTVDEVAPPYDDPAPSAPGDDDSPVEPGGIDDGYNLTSQLTGRWLDAGGDPVADGLRRDGGPSEMTLQVSYGPDHCDWDDIVLLSLAWPVGTVVTVYDPETTRQYARDVDATLGPSLRTTFAADVEAPADAVDTGYHRMGNRLLVGPASAEDAVYVARPGGSVERWPRVVPPAICA
ncbi:MAG TPA: hypothetical protein VNT56_02960 [Acidimicrobiales bacterium]|jgi:hypothetical protein|nr:hypothetical protein [Acidimicrobiales bacterium]